MPPHPGRGESLPRLVEIMQRLLAPDGCPWDRAQSLGSLKAYLIEEGYEVCEAIERRDHAALCEELGDVLLQIVFQAELGRADSWGAGFELIHHVMGQRLFLRSEYEGLFAKSGWKVTRRIETPIREGWIYLLEPADG